MRKVWTGEMMGIINVKLTRTNGILKGGIPDCGDDCEFCRWRMEKSAWKLATEMDEYAENYKCDKCSGRHCEHMLNSRTRKFGRRVEMQMASFSRA